MNDSQRGWLLAAVVLLGCPPAGVGDTASDSTTSDASTSGGASTGGDTSTGDATTGGTTGIDGSTGSDTSPTSSGPGTTDEPPPAICGDGIVAFDELCDLGEANDDHGECTESCAPALCGDGLVHAGVETCDDGDGDACPSNCGVAFDYVPPRIVAGQMHTCVLNDAGKVRCWGGSNPMLPAYGQLGQGVAEGIGDDPGEMPPADVPLGGPAIQVVAGTDHTCALLDGGAVECWGRGELGALGTGALDNIGDEPGEMSPPAVPLGGPAVQLSAGDSHTCALLATGAVKCWGFNMFGQVSVDLGQIVDTPSPDIPLTGKVVQIDAGSAHTCALLESGVPVCWGMIVPLVHEPPHPVGFGGFVVELAHGDRRICARLTGGRVRCMGLNNWGSNGYGHEQEVQSAIVAGDVPLGGAAKRIIAGYDHTCVILDSGALRCWGANGEGHLGYGHTEALGDEPGELPTPDVDLGGVPVDVAASLHTCAILQGGAIRCWGSNLFGSLGHGDFEHIGDQPGEMPPPDVTVD